jgi:hypothetical protein
MPQSVGTMSQLTEKNPQSAIDNPKSPITDSPWFWVLIFSCVGLIALGAISGQYGKRQARLERQYQARERVAEGAIGDGAVSDPARREYATPDDTLVPLWPLAVLLVGVAGASAYMLKRSSGSGNSVAASPRISS